MAMAKLQYVRHQSLDRGNPVESPVAAVIAINFEKRMNDATKSGQTGQILTVNHGSRVVACSLSPPAARHSTGKSDRNRTMSAELYTMIGIAITLAGLIINSQLSFRRGQTELRRRLEALGGETRKELTGLRELIYQVDTKLREQINETRATLAEQINDTRTTLAEQINDTHTTLAEQINNRHTTLREQMHRGNTTLVERVARLEGLVEGLRDTIADKAA